MKIFKDKRDGGSDGGSDGGGITRGEPYEKIVTKKRNNVGAQGGGVFLEEHVGIGNGFCKRATRVVTGG